VAAGERTFGSSRRATLAVTYRHGRTEATYAEEPTTQGRDSYGGLLLPTSFTDYLSRAGAVERYISKRMQWSTSYELNRTSLTVTAFDESREQRTRIDGLPLPDESQRGVSLSATRRLGARTDLDVGASRSRWEYAPGAERKLRSVSIGARHELGARTEVSLRYFRNSEDSKGGSGFEYDADLISLLLTRTF
jgi:uncharacterized protein (PEP-CTERM system associated)